MAGIKDVAEADQVYYEYRAVRIEFMSDDGWETYGMAQCDETVKKVLKDLRATGVIMRAIEEKITKTILDW